MLSVSEYWRVDREIFTQGFVSTSCCRTLQKIA